VVSLLGMPALLVGSRLLGKVSRVCAALGRGWGSRAAPLARASLRHMSSALETKANASEQQRPRFRSAPASAADGTGGSAGQGNLELCTAQEPTRETRSGLQKCLEMASQAALCCPAHSKRCQMRLWAAGREGTLDVTGCAWLVSRWVRERS